MTVRLGIAEAATALAATSDTPRLDAELLMAALLGVTRGEMLLRHMDAEMPSGVGSLVRRRLAHEPIAYILGEAEFYGRTFAVSPAVLIPRADSETIVAAALEACPSPGRVLDCGVGSGALLLTILAERPNAAGVGIDRSPDALAVASENAAALGLDAVCSMRLADWTRPGWSAGLGTFDLVVANPPYVEDTADLAPDVRDHEPAAALFAGADGLADYRVLVPQLPGLLAPDGLAVVEIGHTQAASVAEIAAAADMAAELRRDLAGRPRALILSRA
jgi:release factor glutamine methyltransferase